MSASTSKATIRDIASEAGVSIATVSRVLNGRPDVSPETREAVMTVVRERGFSTNRSARALSGGRTGLVGMATPFLNAPYFAAILEGADEALYERDTRIVMCSTHHRHDREVTLLDRLMHGTTDGAILLLPEETNEELEALQRKRYPFVVVDPRVPPAPGIPSVSAAHSAGALAATRHLLELGHRRIAAITGPPGIVATEDRLSGYRAGLVAAGVAPDSSLEVVSDFQLDGGARAAKQLIDLRDPPTAIFAFNDNLAIGVLRAARERGLRVPDDLSVVGFDDVDNAAMVTPALTTVHQPLEEMGRMAVSLLMRLIEQQPLEAVHIELATRLVIRESTAPPSR
jgi:LacI family transcriptional regulator